MTTDNGLLNDFLAAYDSLPEKCFSLAPSSFSAAEVELILRFAHAAGQLIGLGIDPTTGDPRELWQRLIDIQGRCSQSLLLQKEADIIGNFLDSL